MSYYHFEDSYFVNNRSFVLRVIGVLCFVWCNDDNMIMTSIYPSYSRFLFPSVVGTSIVVFGCWWLIRGSSFRWSSGRLLVFYLYDYSDDYYNDTDKIIVGTVCFRYCDWLDLPAILVDVVDATMCTSDSEFRFAGGDS
jgi:hypothetical protein